jgi:ACS family glucarate transporter-like MFS transporter
VIVGPIKRIELREDAPKPQPEPAANGELASSRH